MDIACAALNGLKMGDRTLTVRRASARLRLCQQALASLSFLVLWSLSSLGSILINGSI